MTDRVHIVGSGLAGLSAAVTVARAGRSVTIYEATKTAGGRCRSFYDPQLDTIVDNGSHVVLGANPAVFDFLDTINARDQLVSVNPSGKIPFVDLGEKESWFLDPGTSRIPWWIFDKERRAPDTNALSYVRGFGLMMAGAGKAVSDVIPRHEITTQRFWDPFAVAVMNTDPCEASAQLLGLALRQAFSTQGGGFQAYVPKTTLADAFVTPALTYLNRCRAEVRFETPVKSITVDGPDLVLNLRATSIPTDQTDAIILAVPPWSPAVTPFIKTPLTLKPSPIVNVHFKHASPRPHAPMTGVVGGTTDWIFMRDGLISATVSAAARLSDMTHEEIAQTIWGDIDQALNLGMGETPAYRVITERRATPIQDCAFAAGRPEARTHASNLFLAGDWLNTGLPCTLESAIRSGKHAAELALTKI